MVLLAAGRGPCRRRPCRKRRFFGIRFAFSLSKAFEVPTKAAPSVGLPGTPARIYRHAGGTMLNDFQNLVHAFAEPRGLTIQSDDPYMVTLQIESLPLHVAYLEESDLLLVQTGVGLPPAQADPAARERQWAYLLCANNLFSQTGGATLGYDPEQALITLQATWPLAPLLQGDAFDNLLGNFLEVVALWMGELAEGEAGLPAEETLTTPPFMLRV